MKKMFVVLVITTYLLTSVGTCIDMGDPDPRPKGIAPIRYTMEK